MVKSVPLEIEGKTYNLAYTYAAFSACTQRYGGAFKMWDKIGYSRVEDGVDENGEPKYISNVDEALLVPELPWLIATMVNQGIMLETGNTKPDNPALITEGYVGIHMNPADFKDMTTAVMTAVALGNGMEHETKNGDPAI
jgi:hypothetical protein